MSQITVTLVNDTGVAQNFAIYDMKVKPDGPPVAAPFLKPGESVQVTVETQALVSRTLLKERLRICKYL